MKELGALASTTRTADQTAAAVFWQFAPIALWNPVARELAARFELDTADQARLYASVNLAATDAAIACWNDKYHYSFWRPRPAIREADSDGNPATVADPNWESLFAPATATTPPLGTPPFPDHPSGHGCLSGAVLQTMADFFGRDKVAFSSRLRPLAERRADPSASLRELLAGAHGGHRRPRLGRHPLPHRGPAGSRRSAGRSPSTYGRTTSGP